MVRSSQKQKPRSYSSPLRQQQKDLTKERILLAYSEIIKEKGIYGFNLQDIADRAGVSYAAVYKYFPSRDSLIEGIYEYAKTLFADDAHYIKMPGFPEKWIEDVSYVFSEFDKYEVSMRAVTLGVIALGKRSPSSRRRDVLVDSELVKAFPNLNEPERKKIRALSQYLSGGMAWLALRELHGLTTQEAGEVVTWAMGLIFKEIKKQQSRSSGGKEKTQTSRKATANKTRQSPS